MKQIHNIIQCINNARIDLEQGGKYNWNEDLKLCDEWLLQAIKRLQTVESNLTFALVYEREDDKIDIIEYEMRKDDKSMKEDITRRVDDLGRIVIPKIIRQQLKIKEGDSFKITVTEDGCILLIKRVETVTDNKR